MLERWLVLFAVDALRYAIPALYFTWWDRIMATQHRGYVDEFTAITSAQRQPTSIPSDARATSGSAS